MPSLAVPSSLSRPFVALLALLLLPLSALLSAAPAHAVAFTATGEVFDALDEPVAGVSATAFSLPANTAVTSDTTAGDGSYELALTEGSYTVRFQKDGFAPTYYGGDAPTTLVVDDEGSISEDGEPIEDNALFPVNLASVDVHDVSGLVKGTGGATVDGILVSAHPADDLEAVADTATTAGGGAYTLQVPLGRYHLDYTDAGGTYLPAWYGGAEPGQEITVHRDGTVLVDGNPTGCTSLCDVLLTIPAPDQTYPVRGVVEDANGDPIDAIAVHAAPTGTTPADQLDDTTTDADGSYLLHLEVGSYEISFDGGVHFADASYEGFGSGPATVTVTPGVVRVDDEVVAGGDLGPAELAGLTSYGFGGAVTDGSTGLAGITVTVFRQGETDTALATATSTTGGAYDVSGLKIGSYVVRFSGSSGGPTYVERWFGAGPAPGAPVQIGQNGVISVDGDVLPLLPDVVMSVAGADTQHPLVGSVVDANYDPLTSVLVTAAPMGGGAVLATDTTGSDGRFQLDVVPGSYQVKYEKTGYPTSYYADPDDETARATVEVALSGAMSIGETTLTEGLDDMMLTNPATRHPVSGTVVDEALTGLSGITVQAITEGTSMVVATATSTSGGAYTLEVPVGTYEISFTDDVVAAPTYAVTYFGGETPTPVEVATGGQVSVDDVIVESLSPVTMTEVAEDVRYDLKGALYDEAYEPLNGATVKVVPVEGTPADNAETVTTELETGTGDLVISYRVAVRPGRYQLEFSKAGYQTTWLAVWDTPTQRVTVTVASNGLITAPGLELLGGVIDDVQLLLPAPALVTAPKLTGKVVVGRLLTATTGTWNPDIAELDPDWQDSTYVEWFLDGKSADRFSSGYYGQRFKLTTAAATKKLSFRVTIDDPDGVRAPAVYTSSPVVVPKAPSSLKATYKARKLTTTLTVPTLRTPTGKITVFDGRKKVGMGTVRARNKGVIVITMATLKKGRHTLSVRYAGTAMIAKSRKAVRIRV